MTTPNKSLEPFLDELEVSDAYICAAIDPSDEDFCKSKFGDRLNSVVLIVRPGLVPPGHIYFVLKNSKNYLDFKIY